MTFTEDNKEITGKEPEPEPEEKANALRVGFTGLVKGFAVKPPKEAGNVSSLQITVEIPIDPQSRAKLIDLSRLTNAKFINIAIEDTAPELALKNDEGPGDPKKLEQIELNIKDGESPAPAIATDIEEINREPGDEEGGVNSRQGESSN